LLHSIGESTQGHDLWVLKFGTLSEEVAQAQPAVQFVSGIHGNNLLGKEMLFQFSKWLCDRYSKDYRIFKVSESDM